VGRAGHDLVLEARNWHALLVVDQDAAATTLTARIDTASLAVVDGTGASRPLRAADRDVIAANLAREVLVVDKHREIRFTSSRASVHGDDALTVQGELELVGTRQPVELRIEARDDDDGALLMSSVAIDQTRFDIEPFSFAPGAVKVADRVSVEAWVRM
jgi:polyisoprenoid-binding protein YceI